MSSTNKYQTTCAKDGGANQSKTTMPPPSEEYRKNWQDIFGKRPEIEISNEIETTEKSY